MSGAWKRAFVLSSSCLFLFAGFSEAVGVAREAPEGEGATSEATLRFDLGCEAYRRGAYAEARAHWRTCLDARLSTEEHARVAYNLGNAAYRQEELLTSVGWYTIALRHAPRDPNLWHNLELVRAEAELEPADRGDLGATLERLLGALLPGEARTLFALGLTLFGLCLFAEALLGGRTWKRLACVALILCTVSAAPWFSQRSARDRDPLLIVRTPSVALRSEPRRDLSPTGKLVAGIEVERVDQLPGWVRVETRVGERGWIQDSAVFELAR